MKHGGAGLQQIVVRQLSAMLLVSSKADADGVAIARGERVPAGQALLIDHAVTTTDSVLASVLELFEDNDSTRANLLTGTTDGNAGEFDGGAAGLMVGASHGLYAKWSGMTPGAVGTLRLQVSSVIGEL